MRNRNFYLKGLLLVPLLALISGCITAQPVEWRDTRHNLAWPQPPDPARVVFLRELAHPKDIVPEKGRVGRFLDLLTGDQEAKVEFNSPYGVATDNGSVVYIADPSAGFVHRYDLANREVTYIVQAGDDVFGSPVGVAVDRNGNLYVSDSHRRKVYKFSRDGEYLQEIKAEKEFQRPAGIAINADGEIFIVDVLAQKLYVFDNKDRFIRSFPKSMPGTELISPSNVAVDQARNVYVTDTMGFMVRVFDHEGNPLGTIGEIGDAPGSFARPKGVAVDSDGHIYVVDSNHDNFQVFDREGTLLLFIGRNGVRPGEFYLPSGIFIDSHDRIFVADTYNHRVQIFQYVKQGGNNEISNR